MSTRLSVLVTGATGKQGGALARLLLGRGHRVRGLTRKPESAAAEKLEKPSRALFPSGAAGGPLCHSALARMQAPVDLPGRHRCVCRPGAGTAGAVPGTADRYRLGRAHAARDRRHSGPRCGAANQVPPHSPRASAGLEQGYGAHVRMVRPRGHRDRHCRVATRIPRGGMARSAAVGRGAIMGRPNPWRGELTPPPFAPPPQQTRTRFAAAAGLNATKSAPGPARDLNPLRNTEAHQDCQ